MATVTVIARGLDFKTSIDLITEECCNCGVVFAMAADFRKQRLADHHWFYCPAGHSQQYTGKTDAEKLQEEQKRTTRLRAELDQTYAAVEEERKHHAATKGQLTKARKRIQNGVCVSCNRHFENLERHMASKHPEPAA